MPFDRKDFAEAAAKKQEDKTRQALPALRVIQAAAPVMDKLMTESDAWNRYLGILQGQVARITGLRDQARMRLADPTIWEPYQLTKLKADVLQADAMLDILKFVMELPKALLEDGVKAQEIVAQFEAQDDATAKVQS